MDRIKQEVELIKHYQHMESTRQGRDVGEDEAAEGFIEKRKSYFQQH
jgi:hypothetical protein